MQTLELFTLSDIMFVNADTLASLQIIEAESHPNKQMQGPRTSGSKESLSVFGLFLGFANSPQGKQKLRQMFLRPSSNLDVIRERQHVLRILLHNDSAEAFGQITKCMGNIKDMRSVVLHIQKGARAGKKASSRSGVWGSLQAFAQGVVNVLEYVKLLHIDERCPQIFLKVCFSCFYT